MSPTKRGVYNRDYNRVDNKENAALNPYFGKHSLLRIFFLVVILFIVILPLAVFNWKAITGYAVLENSGMHQLRIDAAQVKNINFGESFQVSVAVKNSGDFLEEDLLVSIVNCPKGWKCTRANILSLNGGYSASSVITVTPAKDAVQGTYNLKLKIQNKNVLVEKIVDLTLNSLCVSDADLHCLEGEKCINNRCVSLFKVEIIAADAFVPPGEFFDFTYRLREMAQEGHDITVSFWLEKDKKRFAEGSNAFYLGDSEEIVKGGSIFLPEGMSIGDYDFFLSVNNGRDNVLFHKIIHVESSAVEQLPSSFPEQEKKETTSGAAAVVGGALRGIVSSVQNMPLRYLIFPFIIVLLLSLSLLRNRSSLQFSPRNKKSFAEIRSLQREVYSEPKKVSLSQEHFFISRKWLIILAILVFACLLGLAYLFYSHFVTVQDLKDFLLPIAERVKIMFSHAWQSTVARVKNWF